MSGTAVATRPRGRAMRAMALAALLALAACDTIRDRFREAREEGAEGDETADAILAETRNTGPERISVLELAQDLSPDLEIAGVQVTVPDAQINTDWRQVGGGVRRNTGNVAITYPVGEIWQRRVGRGAERGARLLSPPILADGRVYAKDAVGNLAVLNAETGERLWRVRVATPEEDSLPLGGGIAVEDGRLFVTTGFGEVLSLDPANGGLIWRRELGVPIRAAPTVLNGRLFVVTVENELQVMNTVDGSLLWRHSGLLETTGVLGAATPAVAEDVVVVAYSSGEVYALRPESGRPLWNDSLAAVRRFGALAGLADITAHPVIDGDLVYAISHSGRMAAIDIRTGVRRWEQEIGGIQTPWVANDFVYVLTNNNEVVALARATGAIRWVAQLPSFEDEEEREDPIVWSGPVMAGGVLMFVGSHGRGVGVWPLNGNIFGAFELEEDANLPPVVVNEVLYVLSDDGTVTAYR